MGCYDRSKNKLKACALCLLLGLAALIEVSEARKVASVGRVTKPTANRGYANPDIAKLSYSPSQSAAPKPPPAAASAPAPAPAPGWNVPNNAPPPYSAVGNHGPPPAYSAQPNPYAQGNTGFHPPPAYPGAGGPPPAYGAPPAYGHPSAGYQPGVQPGYQGGFQPGGYPQQPGYQPPVGGGFQQQPGTVIHHYESQPSSGGSGIGTVLGAGAAGLAAGVGGAALYDALKPKEEHKEAATSEPTTTTTTTTTTLAPINPNGDAILAPLPAVANTEVPLSTVPAVVPSNLNVEHVPLAPMPAVHENPNGGDVPLAPMPASNSTEATNSTEIVPLAAFPVTENATAVEAPNAALNVQPNQAAASGPTTAPQMSGAAGEVIGQPSSNNKGLRVQFSQFFLLAVLPAICRFLMA